MHKTIALIAAFAATIPLANWLIGNVGTVCVPQGPCLLPVGFGLTAPSGVLVVGASLVLRDMVHEAGGAKAALIAIGIGGLGLYDMFRARHKGLPRQLIDAIMQDTRDGMPITKISKKYQMSQNTIRKYRDQYRRMEAQVGTE